MVLGLILVLMVIAGAWLLYSQKDLLISKIWSPDRSEKARVFKAKIDSPARPSEAPAPEKTVALNRKRPPSGLTSGQKQARADQPPRKIPKSRQEQKDLKNQMKPPAPKVQPPGTTPKVKSGLPRRPAAAAKRSDSAKSRRPAMAPAPQSRAAQPTRSYPRLDDAKLKLQAVAWSNEAAQRIAVINNRVVREGESVEGFSVRQIRQDDVIVNDGTQSWQLEFGLR